MGEEKEKEENTNYGLRTKRVEVETSLKTRSVRASSQPCMVVSTNAKYRVRTKLDKQAYRRRGGENQERGRGSGCQILSPKAPTHVIAVDQFCWALARHHFERAIRVNEWVSTFFPGNEC